MFGTITGVLDRRFVVNALLPAVAFLGLVVAVPISRYGASVGLAWWNRQSGSAQAVLGAAFVLAALVLAYVLDAAGAFSLTVAQGRWGSRGPGRVLAQRAAAWHHRKAQRAADDPELTPGRRDAMRLRYPPASAADEFQATTLGNVLHVAARYPHTRYGINAAIVWPRLYTVLPDSWAGTLGTIRSTLALHMTFATLLALLGPAAAVYLLLVGGQWWLVLAWYWGCAAAAWAAYRAALASAQLYATYTAVTFDAHRLQLRTKLGIDGPETPEQWAALARFWHRNIPLDAEVAEPPTATPRASRGGRTLRPSTAWAVFTLLAGVAGALLAMSM
ncbi:hypothetical protein ABZ671_27270 [Micromonospora sp. NPDC006766]|uniref:hypothetical protein n=1 Tax=Micromonospora sp. NPDC006766 TaxID=3154778 RepID=UPI0033F08D9C